MKLSDVVGKTISNVHNDGGQSVTFYFEDGTALNVSGECDIGVVLNEVVLKKVMTTVEERVKLSS